MTDLLVDKTPADVLREAAAYIGANGWVQNEFGPRGGAQCVYGAIRSCAIDWEGNSRGALDALDALSRHTLAVSGRTAIKFNDSPGRTKDEVIAALLAAADKAARSAEPKAEPKEPSHGG